MRVRFTPYWALAGGTDACAARREAGRDVQTRAAPASVRVVIGFSLARVFEHGPRCR